MNMPNVSKYTSGNLIEVTDVTPSFEEGAETHIKISSDFTGFIPSLSNHHNLSIYVTGTWTLTFDQYIINDNVLVVGSGGKIVIPKGFKLSNGPANNTSAKHGTIIVMPGGEITGEGIVESASESPSSFYNGGIVSSNDIILAGGAIYNAGNLGTASSILTGEANASGNSGQLINFSTVVLAQTKGAALGILNANSIKVANTLTLSSTSRMDDSSTIECGSLSLQGNTTTNPILYMGNKAYLNCSGTIRSNNYGVWGPSGNNYKYNALLKVGSCEQCTTISGNANTFLLDHVQLLIASPFQGFDQIANWMNGDGISSDRQTCYFCLDNSTIQSSNCMIYAFEFPSDNSVRDFDYNDLVLSIATPQDNGNGTFTSIVNVEAIGCSNQKVNLLYNGQDFGAEVHEAMGIATKSTVNTTGHSRQARRLGELTFSSSDIDLGRLPFSIRIAKSDGSNTTTLTQQSSESPLFLAINGDDKGKWFWPIEGTNIGLAYLLFSTWANNQLSATDWYINANANSTQVIKW